MLKMLLTTCACAAALFTTSAFAQKDAPGEDRAAASKPATKEEKAAAKQKRQATSKEMVKADEGRLEDSKVKPSTTKKATAEEKAAGKSKRKAEGAEAAKNAPASAEGSGK